MTSTDIRADIKAVHSIDRVVFIVPELAAANAFYSDFSLDEVLAPYRLHLKTFSHPPT